MEKKEKLQQYKDELWKTAKMYNELSHHYSNIADIYIKVAQDLEEKDAE